MEASSTDKRIDDLSGRVGRFEDRFERFEDKVEARFQRFENKVEARFERLEHKVDAKFDRLEARFDKWGRLIAGGVVAIAASAIARILGL